MANSIFKKVFIVDDTPANLAVLRETLDPEGYQLAFASSGEEALKIIPELLPDLVLLDVVMPGINGFETCRRLKQDERLKSIPIIFITTRKEDEDIAEGFEAGGVDYVPKPFKHLEVCARVRTHLDLSELQKRLEQKVNERTQQLFESRLDVIRRLGKAAEYKDNETGMHVIRMSHYSFLLAKALKLDDAHCELLLNASPMHDIGKIGIPDKILLKPGKLDHDEWAIMKTHAKMGEDLLSGGNSDLILMSQVIASTHHEKWDGTGYPRGTKGEEIPIEGRIVAIADVFDALTSKRPYKKEWTVDEAVSLMESGSGKHFDPNLIPLFKDTLPEIIKIKEQFSDSPD